jgi:outer membrane protein OmpA-like peptidoglycan-associated protein
MQQTVAELDATKKELAALRQQLAAQQANPAATAEDMRKTSAKLDGIEQRMTDAAGVLVRVNFDFASTAFAPTDEAKAELLAGARTASRINVHGHTDSPTPDRANYSIALGRALTARQYLVSNGIDAKKIHLFAQAAGGFVAENRTDQGRRQNRRVDIELIGADSAKIATTTAANPKASS